MREHIDNLKYYFEELLLISCKSSFTFKFPRSTLKLLHCKAGIKKKPKKLKTTLQNYFAEQMHEQNKQFNMKMVNDICKGLITTCIGCISCMYFQILNGTIEYSFIYVFLYSLRYSQY